MDQAESVLANARTFLLNLFTSEGWVCVIVTLQMKYGRACLVQAERKKAHEQTEEAEAETEGPSRSKHLIVW